MSVGLARRARGGVLIMSGVLLGLLLIGYGLFRMTAGDRAPAKAPAKVESVQVLTAARPIGRGQVIAPQDLKTTAVLGAPPAGALTGPAEAVGKVATADIQAQQLVLSSLVSSDPAAAGLALLVPVGQRVISIDTTDEIAVAGFLRPGDLVDIELVLPGDAIASRSGGGDLSESRTLLQNIQVMTVGPSLSGQAADASPTGAAAARAAANEAKTLTLAMTPEQVTQFMLARRLGRFYLSLRNPRDQAVSPPTRARVATIRGAPTPTAPQAPRAAAPRRRAAPRPIELVVGGQRQVIYPGADAQ